MIIKYKEILQILKENPNFEYLIMFDRVFRGDDDYFVASTDWYEREFFAWFKIQLKHYRVWDYEASWDCDKYANAFQCFANICHAQVEPRVTEAIAVAEIHYQPTGSSSRHAIIAVITDNKELKFIEPQKPEFMELSSSEQRSITFMKF